MIKVRVERIFKNTDSFKWKSLLAVFWKTSTLILLVPIMLSNIFIVCYFINASINQIKTYHTETMYVREKTINDILTDVFSKSYSLANMDIVRTFVSIEEYDAISNYQKSQISMAINSGMLQIIGGNETISSAYVYNAKSNYVIGSNYSGSFKNMIDKSWHEEYSEISYQTRIFCRNFDEQQYLSVCYPVKNAMETSLGTVVVNVDISQLFALNNSYIKENKYYFVNNEGRVLLSEDTKHIGKSIFDITNVIDSEMFKKDISAETRKNRLVSVHKADENIGYHVVVSKNDFNDVMKGVWVNIILSILGCVLVWIGASFVISMNIQRSMNNLLKVFSAPDNGIMYDNGRDELDYIYANLKSATDDDKEAEQKNLNKFIVLKNTRLVALQNQITPHFLFNTLQSINVSAMKAFKGNNDVSKMIILLSELVKNAINTDEMIITLEKEIKFAQKYIELQSIKYNNSFSVRWDIDEEVMDYNVVKMCIQPLLENSIVHGVSRFNAGGEIIVTAKVKDSKLHIYVIDNGIQIDENALNNLRESLEKMDEISSKNIGLKNVNWRTKLLFGNEYGCEIESNEVGTCVSICFPLKK